MRFTRLFFTCLLISALSFKIGLAQEVAEPYTARAYWLEEKNLTYQEITKKKVRGDSLSTAQNTWLDEYVQYLQNYYSRLSEEEKLKYREFKAQWDEEYYSKKEASESDILEESHKGVAPGKKYSMYNGIYGAIYGCSALGIFQADLDATPELIAVPFITSGIGMIWPLLNKPRYENLSYNSVMLARHGKFVGLLHGASLGLAIFGDEPSHPAMILAPMVAGSFGLGELGFQLGKKKSWTEGRIATYQYYGVLGPAVTCLGLISANVERGRPYGIAIPVSAALGYWIGDRVYRKYQFTRGDMLAASSFEAYSALAGFGAISGTQEIEMLAPLSTLLAGTFINHALLNGKKLTVKQGWKVNYMSGAGLILGMGVALMTSLEDQNAFILISSAGGIVGWLAALPARPGNLQDESGMRRSWKSSMTLKLTPENYFLNTRVMSSVNAKPIMELPLFRLTIAL